MSLVRSGGSWTIDERDYPRHGALAEQLGFLVQFAVLAPSTRNSQPWKFRIAGDAIDVFIDPTRWQRVSDGEQRELYVSAGCALENLAIAARHFGFAVAITYLPDPANAELAARLRVTSDDQEPRPGTNELFLTIRRRFTNHGVYDGVRVTERDLDTLRAHASEPGLQLVWATDAPTLHTVDELVMRADALLLSNAEYRRELGALIGTGAFGTPWLLATLGRFAVSYLTPAKAMVRADHEALVSSPALGLITSADDTREAQVRAGQMLERTYLLADNLGLSLQPVSQLMQATETRDALAALLARGHVPVQPFRVGYAKPPKVYTPRRPVADVLLT
jgi:hypothetical protein